MKKNNKGFTLLETLIVTTFVVTTLIYLFIQISNIKISYDITFRYNTVPGVYSALTVSNYLSEEGYSNMVNGLYSKTKLYYDILENTSIDGGNSDFYNDLVSKIEAKTIIFTDESLTDLIEYLDNGTLTEVEKTKFNDKFVKFIKKIETENITGVYRVIVEYKDNTYATVKVGDTTLDLINPTISSLVVSGKNVTFTIADNKSLSGYGCNQSSTTEPAMTSISGLTYDASCTLTVNGIYYAWVKDSADNTTKTEFTVTNIDTTNPTVSVTVSGNVGTLTLGDNLLLSGYTITTSTVVPTTWTNISGTSSSQSYTASSAGTYYAWVKDAAGNTSYSSFVIPASAFCAYTAGQIWNFAYTGGVQSFTVPCSGTYKLEVWGAQGGSNTYNQGGLGGLATGNRVLSKDNIIYIVVGGQGAMVTSQTQTGTGGYNGGGTATYRNAYNYRCSGGGGATHMALTTGVLSSIGYTSGVTNGNLLLVGGGGGGGYFDGGNSTGSAGSVGGGTTGGGSYGGTQTSNTYSSGASAGGFGFGSASTFSSGAGGGGLYGGGSAYYIAGSGGSGYLSSSLTSSSMTSGARSGNGYARITLVSTN